MGHVETINIMSYLKDSMFPTANDIKEILKYVKL